MDLRKWRTATEEAEEMKLASTEISSLDERHLVVGPRLSVEPRYEQRSRGTDEVKLEPMDNPRLSDAPIYAPQQQRRSEDIEHNSNDADRVPDREPRLILFRRVARRYSCCHPDCMLPESSKLLPTMAALKRHYGINHHNKPFERGLVCPITHSAMCQRAFGSTIAEIGLEEHLRYDHYISMVEFKDRIKVQKKLYVPLQLS